MKNKKHLLPYLVLPAALLMFSTTLGTPVKQDALLETVRYERIQLDKKLMQLKKDMAFLKARIIAKEN